MFDRFRARKSFNYSRWDGTQRLDDLDARSILDALSDDYLKHGDLRRALERMMQQGFTGQDGQQRMGLQDLMQRLRQQRQQRQQRYNMSGVMDGFARDVCSTVPPERSMARVFSRFSGMIHAELSAEASGMMFSSDDQPRRSPTISWLSSSSR